jgi:hypothetical protein
MSAPDFPKRLPEKLKAIRKHLARIIHEGAEVAKGPARSGAGE